MLAWWCQKWYDKMKAMSREERQEFLDAKPEDSSWHRINEIIEEENGLNSPTEDDNDGG